VESSCQVFYSDTATNKQESVTGSDFALIFHVRFPDQDEYFKVARFQAKKADRRGAARIELDQADRILQTQGVGHYVFYHEYRDEQWTLPPTVMSATEFKIFIDSKNRDRQTQPGRKTRTNPSSLGSQTINVTSGRTSNYDLASFLTFGLADATSEFGKLTGSPREAVLSATCGPTPEGTDGPPRRILVVTLSESQKQPDWVQELRHSADIRLMSSEDDGKD
jgi:hypothetical protein